MAEAEERKIRKNRTFYSRIEEIQEMYGREPTAFEFRALAELPLKEPRGKVSEPYDTSANGRRIRQLLEVSENNYDVSYLDEVGALITFQATRNPYSDDAESPLVYPQATLKPIHSPQKPTSAARSRTTPSILGDSLPVGVPHTQTPPPLPALHLPKYAPQVHNIAPIQTPIAAHHYASNGLGGSFIATSRAVPTFGMAASTLLPNHNGWAGWNQNQPHQHYPTTAPKAYSLSNGHANFNGYLALPYHTSGMPLGSRSNLNGLTGAQLQSGVPSNGQASLNSHQVLGHQPSGEHPAGQGNANGLGGHHTPLFVLSQTEGISNNCCSSDFPSFGLLPAGHYNSNGPAESQPPPVALSSSQDNSNKNYFAGEQRSKIPLVGHVNLIDSADSLPFSQFDLNSHPPEAHQPFNSKPQHQAPPAPPNTRTLSRQSPTFTLSTQPASNSSPKGGKNRGYKEYAEDQLEEITTGIHESSPKKRGKTMRCGFPEN